MINIAIEAETPGDSGTLFRIMADGKEIETNLTAIQAHLILEEALFGAPSHLDSTVSEAGETAARDPGFGSSVAVLLVLGFATFVIGLAAFVVVGVLSPIADGFRIPIAQASWLMTSYALIYAIASPLLAAATASVDRSRVIVLGLTMVLLGSLSAAFASNFTILIGARAIMGMGGGLTAPVVASIGAVLAPPEKRGQALSIVFAGFTVAQVIGVPVGAWLGFTFGWRAPFVIIAILSSIAGVAVLMIMPRKLVAAPTGLAALTEIGTSRRLLLALSSTPPFVAGVYVLYTFLGPFLTDHGLGRDGVALVLALFGCVAVIGNGLAGWLSDRIGPARTLTLLCLADCALLPPITLWRAPLFVTIAAILFWGLASWASFAAQQSRLATWDPGKILPLFALNSSAVYLGGAIGAPLGAAALKFVGMAALGPVGAVMIVIALLFLGIAERVREEPASSSRN